MSIQAPALLLPGLGELPRIVGDGVALRHLVPSDVPALYEVFSDPEVTRYFGIPRMEDLAAAERLLREIDAGFAERRLYQWGVTVEGTVIGTCTLHQLDARNQRAELGFALARAHWGRGLMTAALSALLDHTFGSLDLRRIEADVDPRNAASIRRLEALGFEREGYAQERWIVGGETQDSVLYGLLRRRWRARRGASPDDAHQNP